MHRKSSSRFFQMTQVIYITVLVVANLHSAHAASLSYLMDIENDVLTRIEIQLGARDYRRLVLWYDARELKSECHERDVEDDLWSAGSIRSLIGKLTGEAIRLQGFVAAHAGLLKYDKGCRALSDEVRSMWNANM